MDFLHKILKVLLYRGEHHEGIEVMLGSTNRSLVNLADMFLQNLVELLLLPNVVVSASEFP